MAAEQRRRWPELSDAQAFARVFSSFADYKLRLSKVIDIRGAHAVAARVAKCRPGGLSFSPPAPRQVGRWCGAVQTTTPTASAAPQAGGWHRLVRDHAATL